MFPISSLRLQLRVCYWEDESRFQGIMHSHHDEVISRLWRRTRVWRALKCEVHAVSDIIAASSSSIAFRSVARKRFDDELTQLLSIAMAMNGKFQHELAEEWLPRNRSVFAELQIAVVSCQFRLKGAVLKEFRTSFY